MQKNQKILLSKKIKFALSLSGSLLLSSVELFGIHIELEESPLGVYKERAIPSPRPARSHQTHSGGSATRAHILDMATPAPNQDPLGTCTSFAVKACGEYHYRTALSAAEFTVLAETQLPLADCRPGLFLGKALEVAKTYGLVADDRLPYDDYLKYVARKNGIVPLYSLDWRKNLKKQKSPAICIRRNTTNRGVPMYDPLSSYNTTMYEMGSTLRLYGTTQDVGYRLSHTYPLHHVSRASLSLALQTGAITEEVGSIGEPTNADIVAVKKALRANLPVAASLPVFEGCWEDGTIRMPDSSHAFQGYHAVVLTGFNGSRLRLKNSWGPDWGEDGFADIPSAYVATYSTELVAVGR